MMKISSAAHVSLAGVPTWGMVDPRLRNLHKEHGAFILRLLSWCCGVRGCDAEDVAQLVWVQVHRLGPAPATPRPWITKIAKNVAANERRKASRRRDQPEGDDPVDLVGPGLTAEERLSLRAYLSKLLEAVPNPDQREALFLAAEGLTSEEIGDIQGITPECARQRVHMARERIKQAERERFFPFVAVGFEDFIKPPPAEEVERQWNNIESAIQRPEMPEGDGLPPSSSLPPPLVVPVLPGMLPSGWLPLVVPKVASALAGALLAGAAAVSFVVPAPATCRELPTMEMPSSSPHAGVAAVPHTIAAPAQTAAPSSALSMKRPQTKRPPAEPDHLDFDRRARVQRWSEGNPNVGRP